MNLNDTVQIVGLVIMYLGGIFLIGNFMANTIGKRIDELSNRIGDMRSEMNSRFGEINNRFNDINNRFDDVNIRFDDVNARLNDVNNRIDDLRSQMGREHDILAAKVDNIDHKLSSHITDHEIHSKS